ncbi:diguanylate cyclase [Mesorhizobium sp. M0808]|uniref:GGDEF domain-containing protein n=1 Tax=Mesorhizobium sp. M0808 TaxID=2957002 RepID=UPI00333A3C32
MLNSFLLFAEAVLYFGIMVTLFRFRGRIGLGVFVCALGVMHFLETYLASVFYVALPFGMVSPGSAVLFSGKLVMLLLLYIKEDAATVRQPIYGLLLGNALMIGLVLILRLHDIAPLPDGKLPDIGFIDEMGWLMVWGTTLLFVDAILIILLYEKLGKYLRKALFTRILVSVACVLTFDQAGFFTALHFVTGAPVAVFFGGWFAKMAAALVYSTMLVGYIRWFEARQVPAARGLSDIFDTLTYRERYEALVEHVGRDGLTGLLHRGRFDSDGEAAVAASLRTARALSLLIIDVDHFKSINDRFGHAAGHGDKRGPHCLRRHQRGRKTQRNRQADADDQEGACRQEQRKLDRTGFGRYREQQRRQRQEDTEYPERGNGDEDRRVDQCEQLVGAAADGFGERGHAHPLHFGVGKARPLHMAVADRRHALGPKRQPRQRAARHATHRHPL